jgi:hypothetical protein
LTVIQSYAKLCDSNSPGPVDASLQTPYNSRQLSVRKETYNRLGRERRLLDRRGLVQETRKPRGLQRILLRRHSPAPTRQSHRRSRRNVAPPLSPTTKQHMPGKLIQTTVDASVLRKLDALARAQGHRRASYLRHLVELHVLALTPKLAKITRSTSLLDNLTPLPSETVKPRGRRE